MAGPALGDQERSSIGAERADGRGVDEPDPLDQRVDAESAPDQIQEGRRRENRDVDPGVSTQEDDGALGDHGGSGHGIDDRLGDGGGRRGDQGVDDPGVHLVEGARRVVDVVE